MRILYSKQPYFFNFRLIIPEFTFDTLNINIIPFSNHNHRPIGANSLYSMFTHAAFSPVTRIRELVCSLSIRHAYWTTLTASVCMASIVCYSLRFSHQQYANILPNGKSFVDSIHFTLTVIFSPKSTLNIALSMSVRLYLVRLLMYELTV